MILRTAKKHEKIRVHLKLIGGIPPFIFLRDMLSFTFTCHSQIN